MTLFDVQRLANHWRQFPALRTLVACCAAALGVKLPIDEKPDDTKYLDADSFGAMVRSGAFRMPSNG
jgi:hypothetical protein